MANSSVLSLFQNVMQGMGVATSGNPATVIGNTNQDVVQTLALVNAGGDELMRQWEWQWGTVQTIFTATFFQYTGNTVSGSPQITNLSSVTSLDATFGVTGSGLNQDTYVTSIVGSTANLNQNATSTQTGATYTFSKMLFAPPSDFDRLILRTQWDKSKHWEMLGPSTAQQREWLKSGFISTGPRIRYWQMGGYFQIWPPLGTNETLSYEYQSKNWVVATAGTAPTKQAFAVDTDYAIFPDALMRALIKLKYWEVKGFDTTGPYRDYNHQLELAKATDQAAPTLSMSPRPADALIGWENIPDSNYGT